MRLQDSQAGCGPASMSNALSAMGIARTIPECEALCHATGTAGTSPGKLLRALASVEGAAPARLAEVKEDVAILRLTAALGRGRSAILCVDKNDHWVAVVGMLGDRFLVADPADNELVISLGPIALAARWEGPGRTKYWGILL